MNKTEKWIIGGLCTLFLAFMALWGSAFDYMVSRLDRVDQGQTDLRVSFARLETIVQLQLHQVAFTDPLGLTNSVPCAKKKTTPKLNR
jgi:hypothetical protein